MDKSLVWIPYLGPHHAPCCINSQIMSVAQNPRNTVVTVRLVVKSIRSITCFFSHCVLSRQVWDYCFRRARTDVTLTPDQNDRLQTWWTTARKRIPKMRRKGFDSLVTLVCRNLWKLRNGRVFGRPQGNVYALDIALSLSFGAWLEGEELMSSSSNNVVCRSGVC